MPAFGVPEPLPHVGDRLVVERSPAAGADQGPLILGLLIGERMGGREDGAELLAEEALAGEAREERADRAAESAGRGVGLAAPWTIEPLRRSAPRISISREPSRSRAISSVATEVPMSWAARSTSVGVDRARTSSSTRSACQWSVYVVAGLLGEPEPEEVGAITPCSVS